jgi:hypothetical protein
MGSDVMDSNLMASCWVSCWRYHNSGADLSGADYLNCRTIEK